MTVRELEEYFGDRKFFPNPDQEVRFSLTPYGVPKEQSLKDEGKVQVDLNDGCCVSCVLYHDDAKNIKE